MGLLTVDAAGLGINKVLIPKVTTGVNRKTNAIDNVNSFVFFVMRFASIKTRSS